VIAYGDHVVGHGAEFLAAACEQRLEGVIAKKRDSAYVGTRSKDWLKIKCQREQEFVIGGYTTPQGTRAHFGALHLGLYENGQLVYVSKVGTGFDDKTLRLVSEKLRALTRTTSPFARGTPTGRDHHWVEPRLVCQVRFTEWTRDGGIRHPAFLGLRDDKRPEDCVRESPVAAPRGEGAGDEGPGGVPGPRGARALPAGGWAPSGRSGSDAGSRERVPATPPGPSSSAPSPRGRAGGPAKAPRRAKSAPSASAPDAVSERNARGQRRGAAAESNAGEERVVITNPKKVFWPEEGYTKSDLIDYYDAVSSWLVPYLTDRPLVLTRYPDGIKGKSFFQKDAPEWTPRWVQTARIHSHDVGRDIDYFVVNDRESLRYVANLGTIPLHLWGARLPALDHPDWLVLDLDPKGAPFTDVVKVAHALHRILDELELPSYVKTSGATGLHILLPLGARYDYEVTRTFARLLAVMGVEAEPAISTIARPLRSRGGKVYIDFGQNGRGQTIVAPFSVRPLPGAPVSCPLRWEEVTAKLDPARFTIKTAPPRFAKLGDPLAPVLGDGIDVVTTLRRLEHRGVSDR
jgi:bifunctional non-homologous end joining protein LigD